MAQEWHDLHGPTLRERADAELEIARTYHDGDPWYRVGKIAAHGFSALVLELRAIHADNGRMIGR